MQYLYSLLQPFESCFTFAADVDLACGKSSSLVDKYSIHNLKFSSLSIIVDGAKLLCFNVCIYLTKVEVFKIVSMCLASEPCATLLKNFTTSMLFLLTISLSFPSAASKFLFIKNVRYLGI